MSVLVKAILSGVIMAVLVFVLYDRIFPPKNQGPYDMHYVVTAVSRTKSADENNNKDILGETPAIIKHRLSELGYKSVIRILSGNRLNIEVEKATDTLLIRQTITRNNQLEFREIYTLNELPSLFKEADNLIRRLSHNEDQSIYTVMSPLAPFETEVKDSVVFPAAIAVVGKKDTAVLSNLLERPSLRKVIPSDLQFCYGVLTDDNIAQNIPDDLYLYALRANADEVKLQNSDIDNATATQFYDGPPQIILQLNKNGKAKWAAITQANIGRYLVTVLDGVVVAAPKIYHPDTKGSIRLNTRFTSQEAGKLATQLKTGMLPADLVITLSETSDKGKTGIWGKMLFAGVVFLLTSTIAFLIFNGLKNRIKPATRAN